MSRPPFSVVSDNVVPQKTSPEFRAACHAAIDRMCDEDGILTMVLLGESNTADHSASVPASWHLRRGVIIGAYEEYFPDKKTTDDSG